MAKKILDGGVAYLALASFLVVFQASETMDFGMLFPFVIFITVASVCILVAQFLLFNSGKGGRKLQLAAAVCITVLTILELLFLASSKGYLLLSNFKFVQYMVVSCFMLVASLLPMIFGADILRRFRDRRLKLLGLMLIAFAVFAVAYFFFVGFSRVSITDAAWLTYHGSRTLLVGRNPYPLNYSGLYNSVSNGTANSFTLTTGGKIVGVVGYPILYLVLSMPFAAFSSGLTQFSSALLLQEISYAVLLFAVIAYFGKGIGKREFVALLLVVPLLFFTLVSLTDIVMIAALLIAYLRPHKWYFGVALGIAASIQQLAWIPALMLLLYSVVTSDRKKAVLDVGVSVATVLLINGYFLLASPASYLHDLLGQLGSVLPTALAPFGSLIIRYYNIPLPYFQFLFYLALAASAITFLCLRRRWNFAILSLVPFLFLSFGRIEYYTVIVVLAILAAVLDMKGNPKRAPEIIRPAIAAFALAAFAVAMIAVIFYGHSVYLRSFPVTVSVPSALLANGTVTYSGSIGTGNLSGEERILLYSFYRNFTGDVPAFIIGDTVVLQGGGGNFIYSYNSAEGEPDNLIYLWPGLQRITIASQNNTGTYSACAIYNDAYFYICPTTGITG